jgi:hypothetical protein
LRGSRQAEPQRQDSGLMGFRYPEEPADSRPVLRWQQFWADESERVLYEAAVAKHRVKPGEGPMAYAARISAAVTGAYKTAGQAMPRRGPSQRQWQERQWQVKQGGMARYEEPVE